MTAFISTFWAPSYQHMYSYEMADKGVMRWYSVDFNTVSQANFEHFWNSKLF